MNKMRKASREMPADWALDIMRKAPYITVSFIRPDGTAYGVPLSLASTDDKTWYFHCAPEGDKLDAIAAHPEVCLSAVTKCTPTVGPNDGSFTLQYRSAIAFGRAVLVTVPFGHCFWTGCAGDGRGRKSSGFARHQRTFFAPTYGCFRRSYPSESASYSGSPHHLDRVPYRKAEAV